MRPLLRTALACTLLVLLAATRQALAGVPTDQLRMQVDRVLKLLDDPALKAPDKANERRVAVRKVAEDIFDFGETAKRSLGRHWAARTPQERDEFTKLFGDLLERSYISKIELYGGEKIQYVGDRIEGDTAIVQSKLLTKSGGEVPIDYRMLRKGDRWLVYDVVIEGVSLVSNYRTQFNKIIQTSSYQDLVKKMKTRNEELRSAELSHHG
ncbi:MAG TPA: ABC transporter substrate-binding protein [Methylomirabilota bacterium]|jgi:phospholipid transport system substrate-binding protein|nr:ABC transporter substrate-binding protein [Methylomirabilota bacterium]